MAYVYFYAYAILNNGGKQMIKTIFGGILDIWQTINILMLLSEIALILVGALVVLRKNNAGKTFFFVCGVFVLNLVLYNIPWIYNISELGKEENAVLNILESVSATIKQFVGEVRVEEIADYAKVFPLYTVVFFIGTALALISTFGAAIGLFGKEILNYRRCRRIMEGDFCDIVIGNSQTALGYAKQNPNCVLLLYDNVDKEYKKSLIETGYVILRKNLSAELFSGRIFNQQTTYNIICPNDNNLIEEMDVIFSYLQRREKKKIYFYLEADARVLEIVQNQIDKKEESENQSGEKSTYREYITIFNRNELIARTFVEKNPITKHMGAELFETDTSVKADAKIDVFMLGFGELSREIYKQFVINNQLAIQKDGEYRAFPLNYHIYDAEADQREWMLGGLHSALEELRKNEDKYFPLPDMPYCVNCICEKLYGMDCVREICKKAKENSLSYIMIDTGDVYRNIELANQIKLLLDGKDAKFHIFIYNESLELDAEEYVSCYGKVEDVFTHEVIVNESLIALAKAIDREYFKLYNDPTGEKYTEEELLRESGKQWKQSSYFTMYSNIYLANNIRLKLNLLGLDYEIDAKGEGIELIPIYMEEEKTYEKCLAISTRSAMLAQEHFRWNAYHLLNGFLPMKKERIKVEKKSGKFEKKTDKIKVIAKNIPLKKHACLTTYQGLDALSDFIAQKATQICPDERFEAKDFGYYANDGMLMEIAPGFFQKNGYSVFEQKK